MQIDNLLQESPQTDFSQRQRAERAYRDLLAAFQRIDGLDGMRYSQPMNLFLARPDELKHPEGIGLVIRDKQGNNLGGMEVEKKILHLFLDLSRGIEEQLKSNKIKTDIIHEFIHLFDKERMGAMRRSEGQSEGDYYNNPAETNAYYQEAISRFEDALGSLKNAPSVMFQQRMREWQNFDTWLEDVHEFVDRGFRKNITLKNDMKLKRRLYKYWNQYIRQ